MVGSFHLMASLATMNVRQCIWDLKIVSKHNSCGHSVHLEVHSTTQIYVINNYNYTYPNATVTPL